MRKIALLDYLRLLLISTLVGRAAGVASVAGVQKPLVATQAAPIVAQYWPAYKSDIQAPPMFPWASTDVAYYFVLATTATGLTLPAGQSEADVMSFVQQAHSNQVIASVSIGGWGGGVFFSDLVSTPTKCAAFAQSIKAFMVKYSFDGVDLDWEYPGSTGIGCNSRSPADSANLLAFLAILRVALSKTKLITAAVNPAGFVGADGNPLADFAPYARYLNFINIMSYDFSGRWSAGTGPNSPLQTCGAAGSVAQSVSTWVSRGFPASQILLGIPAYGISFTTQSATLVQTNVGGYATVMYQPVTSVTPKGDVYDVYSTAADACGTAGTGFNGIWQYKTLISGGILSADGSRGIGGYTKHFDNCTQTPILFNPTTKDFISYEDSQSAIAKTDYALQMGLGGVFIFDSTGFNEQVLTAIQTTLAAQGS